MISAYKTILLTLIIVTCWTIPATALSETDSLKNVLRTTKNDSVKYKVLVSLIKKNIHVSVDSALYYGNKLVKLSEKEGNLKHLANAHRILGFVYDYFHYSDKGFSHYKKAEKIYLTTGDSTKLIKLYYNFGLYYSHKNDLDSAGYYFLNGKQLIETFLLKELNGKEQRGLYATLTEICAQMGGIYLELNRFEDAAGMYREALKLAYQHNFKKSFANTQFLFGRLFITYNKPDSAFHYLKKAEKNLLKNGQLSNYASALTGIGNYYWTKGMLDSTYYYYLKALRIKKKLGDNYQVAYISNNLGAICKDMKRYDEALRFLNNADSLMKNRSNFLILRQNAKITSALYSDMHDFEKALQYYKRYTAYKDSILNEKTEQQIAMLKTKYETQKKEAQIQKQAQMLSEQRKIIGLIIILVIVSSLLLWLAFNRYKLNQKEKENRLRMNKLEMEQKLLRLQINPHFIFNSLNSIKGYILQNNPDTAALYLDKFAKLMRMILENAAESELPFEEDIHILQLYLELEQKRFPGKFDFSFDIDETIDTERTYIIPMLIQPFVENSIKHGFKNLKRKGNLIIKYEKREKFIVCTIIDNGTGRINEKNTNRNNKHKSMGIKLTSERLSYATNKTDDYIRFFDLKDDKGNPIGTKVEIFIPYSLDL